MKSLLTVSLIILSLGFSNLYSGEPRRSGTLRNLILPTRTPRDLTGIIGEINHDINSAYRSANLGDDESAYLFYKSAEFKFNYMVHICGNPIQQVGKPEGIIPRIPIQDYQNLGRSLEALRKELWIRD